MLPEAVRVSSGETLSLIVHRVTRVDYEVIQRLERTAVFMLYLSRLY